MEMFSPSYCNDYPYVIVSGNHIVGLMMRPIQRISKNPQGTSGPIPIPRILKRTLTCRGRLQQLASSRKQNKQNVREETSIVATVERLGHPQESSAILEDSQLNTKVKASHEKRPSFSKNLRRIPALIKVRFKRVKRAGRKLTAICTSVFVWAWRVCGVIYHSYYL